MKVSDKFNVDSIISHYEAMEEMKKAGVLTNGMIATKEFENYEAFGIKESRGKLLSDKTKEFYFSFPDYYHSHLSEDEKKVYYQLEFRLAKLLDTIKPHDSIEMIYVTSYYFKILLKYEMEAVKDFV